MLGKLEVSSIGIGVQNNSRKYTTELLTGRNRLRSFGLPLIKA